jgi:intein-encoded DNA endonuclease-like protein
MGRKRKYLLNENFFNIETNEMSYILGLWYADGSISKTHGVLREFNITLKESDKYLLEKIKNLMGTNIPLKKHTKRPAYALRIFSTVICKQIQNLGGTERKSHNLKIPKISDMFFPSFLRGFFDGDGSIYYYKQRTFRGSITSGDLNFLKFLQIKIKEINSDFTGGYIKDYKTYWTLNF